MVFRVLNGLIKKTWEHPKADVYERLAFQQHIDFLQQQGHPIVYVDETGMAVDTPRRYGYSPKGIRCLGKWNWHEKGRKNAIGAVLDMKILQIDLYDTTIKSDIFEDWCVHKLIPKLPPNAVVVMDNAKFHRKTILPDLFTYHGVQLLFQPTYSPDLNQSEHKWSGMKAFRVKHHLSPEQTISCYK